MLNTVDSILVIVDVQGRLAEVVDRADLVLPKILQMIKGCQALDIPIITTLQVPEKLGAMPPALAEVLGEVSPIPKISFSALRAPDFMLALHQLERKQVILMGIETHVCVLQTGLDLLDAGYEVYVLSDGTFSRTAENHDLALQRLHDAGAVISSVETVLFELLRTARHLAFRTISKLVK